MGGEDHSILLLYSIFRFFQGLKWGHLVLDKLSACLNFEFSFSSPVRLETAPTWSWSSRDKTMITKSAKSFSDAVEMEWIPPRAGLFLRAIVNFSEAPTTSENLTITHKSSNGDAYDDEVYSIDPSTGGLTLVRWVPDVAVPLTPGDKILIEYANSDSNNIHITLIGLDSSAF